jgi:hypothetical protein
VAEIIALEQQRMIGHRRKRVGKTITDIKGSTMPPAPEAAKRIDRDQRLLRRDTDDLKPAIAEQHL